MMQMTQFGTVIILPWLTNTFGQVVYYELHILFFMVELRFELTFSIAKLLTHSFMGEF